MSAVCCDSEARREPQDPAQARSRAVLSAIERAGRLIQTWRERARSRRELALIEPWVWKDLGLGSYDVRRELEKPFWRD
jgi:uncharacterized protein YjiS (DUF1127 family)